MDADSLSYRIVAAAKQDGKAVKDTEEKALEETKNLIIYTRQVYIKLWHWMHTVFFDCFVYQSRHENVG